MATCLTSEAAVRKLRDAVDLEANKFSESASFANLISSAFFHHFPTASCWILISMSFLSLVVFIFAPIFVGEINHVAGIYVQEHIIASALLLLVVLVGTCVLNIYFVYLRTTEIRRKINSIVGDLDEIISDGITGFTTPSLYEPASESITLQWTYRDGVLVNLPWITLVEGDIILLRPGRDIPCRCRPLESNSATSTEFESGRIYIPQETHQISDGTGANAFLPLLCRVEETPAATYVRDCLHASERPLSLTENEYGRILHFYVERIGLPIILGVSISAAVFNYVYNSDGGRLIYEVLAVGPAAVILPLSMPLLSLYTWVFVLFHTARFLVRFADVLASTPQTGVAQREDELFAETSTSVDSSRITEQSVRRLPFLRRTCFIWSTVIRLARVSWKLLKGDPSSLPFSANIVQTLGNITSLSIVDKKGIMSWANPTPEKVFFFSINRHKKHLAAAQSVSQKKHRHPSNNSVHGVPDFTMEREQTDGPAPAISEKVKINHLTVDGQWTPVLSSRNKRPSTHHRNHNAAAAAAARAHTEVLDLSHDPHRSFVVHFDDPHWRNFSSSLKPLGLNILLNSCNLHAEYIRFIDHVHAISAVVPRTVAVVNRRCLCFLARTIGFNRSSCACQFETQQTLAAYRKTPGDLPLPGLTKHKTPFPNLFAVVVRDKITGHGQLMCQGTADLVMEASDYYWDGVDVKPLEKQHRKKISDFAQRHSVTAYCVAFSYRPLVSDVDRALSDIYIDWPVSTRYPVAASADSLLAPDEIRPWHRVVSYDSLLTDEYFDVRVIDAPSDVLNRLLKGQVFLGMISLQYQAKPDVVRLVDSLDRACIRFVHYSKENELRSRIFAEKCGLEAGWNCHISLCKESETVSVAGSHLGSQQIGKLPIAGSTGSAARGETKWTISRRPSRRRTLPGSFKVDVPTVHFKSAAASPVTESLPKVICTSTEATIDQRDGDNGQDDDEELTDDNSSKGPLEKTDRCPSVATISGDSVFDDPTDQQLISALSSKREQTPLLSDTTSRTSVVTNHSTGNQPIALPPNRARLPKGIENVRPHLESVDNVPLLVPLFTDCYPNATVEMIGIMQEYGEIVCVLGSSLNFRNAEIFCQANASIGIEPLHPAVCMNKTDRHRSETTTDTADAAISATDLATLISTLPCSISIYAGEQINLLDLIATSRHFLMVLRTSWLFYLAASMMTCVAQVFAQLVGLPRPFTIDLLIWLVCVVIPLLSGSLCATPQHVNVLKTATPKNSNWVSQRAVRKFLIGFTLRFLPSAIFALLLFKCSLVLTCASRRAYGVERCGTSVNRSWNLTNESAFGKESDLVIVSAVGLTISRYLFSLIFVLYLCAISAGFVHYRALFKDHLPWTNGVWSAVVILLLVAQLMYTILCIGRVYYGLTVELSEVLVIDENFVPWKVYLCGLVWPLVSVPLNELLKHYELERYRRDQRRRRLSFGTKLGMNSPF